MLIISAIFVYFLYNFGDFWQFLDSSVHFWTFWCICHKMSAPSRYIWTFGSFLSFWHSKIFCIVDNFANLPHSFFVQLFKHIFKILYIFKTSARFYIFLDICHVFALFDISDIFSISDNFAIFSHFSFITSFLHAFSTFPKLPVFKTFKWRPSITPSIIDGRSKDFVINNLIIILTSNKTCYESYGR